jgi:hypothetical protein
MSWVWSRLRGGLLVQTKPRTEVFRVRKQRGPSAPPPPLGFDRRQNTDYPPPHVGGVLVVSFLFVVSGVAGAQTGHVEGWR